MKTILFIPVLCATLNLAANTAEISIRLEGYNSAVHKNFAEITVPDLNYPQKEQLQLDQDGKITCHYIISRSREIVFSYDGRSVPILVAPEDHVFLQIGMEDLLKDYTGNARITGVHQRSNALILKHLHTLEDWISGSGNAFAADKSTPENDYEKRRKEEMQFQFTLLDSLIGVQHISDSTFIIWANSKIRYAAGADYCLFPFIGRINNTLSETDTYFNFIREFEPASEFITTLASYVNYTSRLASSLSIMGAIADKHASQRTELQQAGLSSFPVIFQIVSGLNAGSQRESIMVYIFKNSKNIPSTYLDSLSRYIPADAMERLNRPVETQHASIVELLKNYSLTESEKQDLLNLYEGSKGKLVFHDFWFLGCAPCMAELPHYNDLIQAAGDQTEFIFFAAYMKREDWERTLQKYNLKGKHYLLSKNQLAFFERYFGVRGFPHHQVLNKKGEIVDGDIPAIKPENQKWILKILEELR